MPAFEALTPNRLARLIGTPDAPVLLDLRIDEDFDADPTLIPSAARHDFRAVAAAAPALHGRRAVLYCHKGLKISEGAAAMLRSEGVRAEILEGGYVA